MDREYLEDYEQKELEDYKRLVLKRIQEGKFDFKKGRYPPEERFINLQKPVAEASFNAKKIGNLLSQIPFCGSLVFTLPSFPKAVFEKAYFDTKHIPKIIDFVKETGRLQLALKEPPTRYAGLDFLDPFFKELNPPVCFSLPVSIFGNEKEIQVALETFYTLAGVGLLQLTKKASEQFSSRGFQPVIERFSMTYTILKLGHYSIVEDLENLMIDNPLKAYKLLLTCGEFITAPLIDLNYDLANFTFEDIRDSHILPSYYQAKISLPCEIGRFLLKKLTYAPQGFRACNDLIDHYDAYDLQRVLESLNEAIVTNHRDILDKNAEELSKILDNVWNDKTIPRRVKGLQIGIPLSMAAIGSVAAGPIGAAGGFLAGLGYSVADKFINLETEGLSERIAKLKTKSYQANIYDFKEKYKAKIVH